MTVAVIPARGGSNRLPGKNKRPFLGKPMLARPIEAALSSRCFNRVIVSTDDQEIAELARQSGAEAPFTRPAELSDDHSTTADVMRHALNWLDDAGSLPELACCLYATAAFVGADLLRDGLKRLQASGAEYAVGVARLPVSYQRTLAFDEDGRIAMNFPQYRFTRSQDLEPAYYDAGQFYWGRARAWLDAVPILSRASVPVVIPRSRVQDIDSPEDWMLAERLFAALHTCPPDG